MDHMRYTDLDLEGLRAFLAIAETGGFTAAGNLLGRSQSAMSIKIRKLEESLGRQVFTRTSRSLALTHDGELLLTYARRLLALNDEAVQRFAGNEASGSLRLGVAEYVVPEHLPELLARFRSVYPAVDVEVRVAGSAALVTALDKGDIDLAIAKRDDGETRGQVIRREALVWACSRSFAVDGLEVLPLCMLPAPCIFRSRAIEALKVRDWAWRVVYTSDSVNGVVAAIRAGLGISAIAESSLLPELRILTTEDGFPDLDDVELTVFGLERGKNALKATLISFLQDRLETLDAGRRGNRLRLVAP
jgi:DNA-binding transcriptional LysR family regulator